MAITLNGVPLSGSLQWTDKEAWQSVAQTTVRTLGGGLVIRTQALSAGRPVTLEATEETGWITRAQLNQVLSLANVPGAVYTLVVHSESFNVVFRHDEPPAVDFRPLQPRATPQAGDYYIGVMKFLTV